jgi:1-aminocyclopropane-1-carboxylate deaminase
MQLPSPIQKIETPWSQKAKINLWIKRDDLIHPQISGNKFRKLKYNILQAQLEGKDTILSFGGAFSNHIHALAAYTNIHQLKSIGIIRGEESNQTNPTLSDAVNWRMQLKFVDRSIYRNKADENYLKQLKDEFGDIYIVPEGGTNQYAIQGSSEIIKEIEFDFDYICTAVGTGGTIAGLIKSCPSKSKVLGFSALKGDFLQKEVEELLSTEHSNWSINTDFHCGGYAKTPQYLWYFIEEFKTQTQIQLDAIYTSKMMLGIKSLAEQGFFKQQSTIVALHTGGLQGLRGFTPKT